MGLRITIRLFGQQSMDNGLKDRLAAIRDAASLVPDERIFAEDLDALAAQIVEKHDFQVPTIHFDQAKWDEPSFQAGSSAASLAVYLPVNGEPRLLACYHRYSPGQPIEVEVQDATLIYRFSLAKDQLHLAQRRLGDLKKHVDEYLPNIEHFASLVKDQMREAAKQPLLQRHKELEANRNALQQFRRLGFPLRRRSDDIAQVYFPIEKKVITVPDSPRKLDENPHITMEAYEDILGTITAMAHGFERSPSAFREMGEEDFRMVLLIGLNAVYEGKATGETFNNGKTDILIRVGDSNIFIAECFVWDGVKTAESKLDGQLMTYAMWRDTKTALIVFNRTMNLTAVVRKLRASVKGHPQCIQVLPYDSETGFRYLFRRKDDPERHFYLTCLVFDVASPQKA